MNWAVTYISTAKKPEIGILIGANGWRLAEGDLGIYRL
jgi:hypothetical protein